MLPIAETSLGKCPSLDQVIQHIDEISSLPHVVIRIMQIVNDANMAASEIRQVMEGDPALSARVLRCVNSSAYGLRTKITNLQQAINYLGLKQIRNLAMVASVSDMFKTEATVGSYCRSNLWKHMVSVGICSRLIAMRLGFVNFEDMFLAGLLHDIGIILEDQHIHQHFVRMLYALDQSKSLVENEHMSLEFDHTQLGAKVAVKWDFPEGIHDAIRFHHTSVNYRGEHVNLVQCVEVANILCTLKDITSIGQKLGRFPSQAIQNLGLHKQDLVVISQDLDRELRENAALVQIGA